MKRLLLAACLIPLLSGCGDVTDRMSKSMFGDKEETAAATPDCPATGVMTEANELPIFAGKAGRDNLAATGFVGNISGHCDFDSPGAAQMEIKISFASKKGPKGVSLSEQELPYFIAVLDPGEQVLQRKSFSTKIDFDNAETAGTDEEHDLRVPVPSKEAAHSYKVVVGFELTPEQLGYNREGKLNHASQD